MSQHFYNTLYQNRPVEIVIGWDRPLQYYFMWIRFLDISEDEEGAFLWNSIDAEHGYPKEINCILEVLNRYKIEIPTAMIRAVEEDGLKNEGNKEVVHVQSVKTKKSKVNDFNVCNAYDDLVRMIQVIIERVITGIKDDKITISNPDSLQYIDFEGEGLILNVSDNLSSLAEDLQSSFDSEHGYERHERLKDIFIKLHQALEGIGGHEPGHTAGTRDQSDYLDINPYVTYEDMEQLAWRGPKGTDSLFSAESTEPDNFDSHAAYRELIETIYFIIDILGKAVKRNYFAKADTDYLTLAHGEFISKRAIEILCDDRLKKTPSNKKNLIDNKIYSLLHEEVGSLLKAVPEILDYKKPLSSCSLF